MINMIGILGFVTFETSSRRIRTFNSLQRSGSSRWATHEIIGKKPVLEFLGPGVEQIAFEMRLDIALGVDPADSFMFLRWSRDNGFAMPFILGGQPVSENLWVIQSMNENWRNVDNRGKLLSAEAEITLMEYVPGGGS